MSPRSFVIDLNLSANLCVNVDPQVAGGHEMYEVAPTDEKGVYRYYCKARPPMIGGIPHSSVLLDCEAFEDRRYIPEVDCMVWGWLEYDHPLSSDEIFDYELRSAPREE